MIDKISLKRICKRNDELNGLPHIDTIKEIVRYNEHTPLNLMNIANLPEEEFQTAMFTIHRNKTIDEEREDDDRT